MKKSIFKSIPYFFFALLGFSVLSCNQEFSKVLPEIEEDSVDVIYGKPKVLLLIADGARGESVRTSNVTNINALLPTSIYSWNSLSEENAIAIESNWANIFTGVNYQKHGVRDNNFENNKFDAYPLIFDRIKDNMHDSIEMAMVSSNEDFLTQFGQGIDHQKAQNDEDATAKLLNAIKEDDLSFITGHFTAINEAGKSVGYDSSKPAYKAAIEKFDGQIGELVAALKKRENYDKENWLVIITSSQGGEFEIPDSQNDNTIFSNPAVNTFTIIHSPKFSTKFVGKPFIGNKFIGDFMQFKETNYAQLDSGDNTVFNLDNNDFTIELKIKKNKGKNNNYSFSYPSLIGKRKHWQGSWDKETDGIGWVIHLAGESWIFNARGENGTGEIKADKNLNRGTWNTITVTGATVDGKRIVKLFTNGELSKEGEITGWGSITSSAKFRIGFLETREGWR
ncbi:MAG: alkaline phosphatase family protein, partial [Sphingobacterium sp.]